MIRPTLEEARQLTEGNTVIPIAMEIFSDVKTSIEILRNIRGRSERFFILESVAGADNWGRYTFLGYDPTIAVSGTDGKITTKNGGPETVTEGDPVAALREMLGKYKSPRIPELPPFTGGFVGYFAYDFIKYFEPSLKLKAKDEEGFRDFHLMLMDRVIAFDHFKQKIFLIVNIPVEDIENSYIRGVTVLKDMERMVLENTPAEAVGKSECGTFTATFTEEQYHGIVEKAKHYIREGDIFQVVPSNRFTAPFKGDLLETYRMLRTINPSPYMVYMQLGDMEIACASPETLVSLKDGKVSTFPLAGTCPRGETEEEDATLIEALLQNEKELAEHDMLVDLGRNDLGKVSRFGTVKVKEHRQIKRFSHVSHIASRVTGRLQEDKDAVDVIAATLPAGTLSGAPKKRACEIIDELEGVRRGVYGGAMGYIDFAGNMDMCIGIRMAVLKNGKVFVQSGGGVVADSDPAQEYREIQNKAKAIMNALQNETPSRFMGRGI